MLCKRGFVILFLLLRVLLIVETDLLSASSFLYFERFTKKID